MSHPKTLYLKVYRKRSGFTQQELAYLLGGKKASAVSRYESKERHPDLATAFVYELMFERALPDLFSMLYARVGAELAARVRHLLDEMAAQPTTASVAYKRAKLQRLAKKLGKSATRV